MTGALALALGLSLEEVRGNYEDRIVAQSNRQFYTVEETEKSFVESPIGAKKHLAVGAGSSTASNLCDRPICLFVDSFVGKGMSEPDHLCLTSVGSMNAGFKWGRSQQSYDKDSKSGYLKVDFATYMKGESQGEIDFLISIIWEHTLELLLDSTEFEFHQEVNYFTWENKLCIDVYAKISEIQFVADTKMQLAECYKYLIDSMLDFGQMDDHPSYSDSTRKPFFDYARFIDKCSFSDSENITIKKFRQEPFYSYFVGDGTSGNACFPGDILAWLAGAPVDPAATTTPATTPPVVSSEESGFVKNYIKPWIQIAVHKGMEWLHDIAEDGDYKVLDEYKWNTDDYHQDAQK